MFRIAHISDTHVLSRSGAEWRQMIFNKRITGFANTILRRGRVHRREYLLEVMYAAARDADHIVITGDITNLALESEYDEARALFDSLARSVEVSVIPGNHDIYLPSTNRDRRFPHHFRQFLKSDLPEFAIDSSAGPFPYVKLRGPAAIIGLSSAVPRPPFIAAGLIGHAQLDAFHRVLAHPEVAKRMPVILVHHAPVDSRPRLRQLRDGLVDARALQSAMNSLRRGLVLFGHIHVRTRTIVRTSTGALDIISASGAALDHPDLSIRAGFNAYNLDADGNIAGVEARAVDGDGGTMVPATLRENGECM